MMKLIDQRAVRPDKAIAVSLVSEGMLDFTYNWICSVRRFNFFNYVILASDHNTYASLQEAGEPVVFIAGHAFGDNEFLLYGTTAYQGLMHIRLLYVKHLLQLGYRVLLFDVDQVWTANPFDFIDRDCSADLHTQNDARGAYALPCMGFMYLNPTPALLTLWDAVRVEHSLRTRTRPYTESATEQAIFTAMSTNLTRHYLNNELFINGGLFWDEGVRIQHFQPVQIHVNFVVGKENKHQRLLQSKLWVLADNKEARADWNAKHPAPGVCSYERARPRDASIAVPPPRLHEMVVVIKVFPSVPYAEMLSSVVSFNSLKNRLRIVATSLLSANYSSPMPHLWSEKRIDIELHRPTPPAKAIGDRETLVASLYDRTLSFLQKHWAMGEVREASSRWPEAPAGLEARLEAWSAESDSEVAIMIDDAHEVTPEWWRWVRYAVGAHHCSLDGFNVRLFGAVLETNIAIIANPPTNTSAYSAYVNGLLSVTEVPHSECSKPFYFQNMGYRANLFFPRLWRRFQSWVAEWKAAHPGGGQYPKLAGLNYARMHALAALAGEEPKEMKRNRWYAWWAAFTADLGLAGLHPPSSVSVVNTQPLAYPRTKEPREIKRKLLVPRPLRKSKRPAPPQSGTLFLDPARSPLTPIGDPRTYHALDFRGLPWRATFNLDGLLNNVTTLFHTPSELKMEKYLPTPPKRKAPKS